VVFSPSGLGAGALQKINNSIENGSFPTYDEQLREEQLLELVVLKDQCQFLSDKSKINFIPHKDKLTISHHATQTRGPHLFSPIHSPQHIPYLYLEQANQAVSIFQFVSFSKWKRMKRGG
jgi:hypothetical protein